jgi:FemAB-related protein (PEP-CTERM system-associated)
MTATKRELGKRAAQVLKFMIKIQFYQDVDQPRWDSYVLTHSYGTFFHLIGWKNVIETTFGHKSFYLLAEEDQEALDLSANPMNSAGPINSTNPTNSINPIVGILPLFSVKSFLFCKSLVSLPFAAYGGILANTPEIANQLLEKAKDVTRSQRLEFLELRNRNGGTANLPSKGLYFTFRREIFKDLDSNMKAIPRKSRRMLRVGEKEGLTHEFGKEEFLPDFYEIFAKSYHRLGSPVFSVKLFKNLFKEFKENITLLIVRNRGGKPISGVMSFFYKDEVLPYYAGSLSKYRDLAPNDFMYWQLMKHGCEKGYRLFDFGRSKVDTGSYDFKRHWGFEPEPLSYQYYLNGIDEIPNISPANPKYQRKIEMWQKMPFWLTKIIGPRIVRNIP